MFVLTDSFQNTNKDANVAVIFCINILYVTRRIVEAFYQNVHKMYMYQVSTTLIGVSRPFCRGCDLNYKPIGNIGP